jgi:hypothetical protein
VPQYTQTQINEYYAQYGCYPPHPYEVAPETVRPPTSGVATGYLGNTSVPTSGYHVYGGSNLTVQEQPRCVFLK